MISPWVSFLLETCMALLMAALIVYCVKLNRRLALLRNQDSDIRELIAGLSSASERAEMSVQRLKAAGLAAERSLRSTIEDATAVQGDLAGLVSSAPRRAAGSDRTRDVPRDVSGSEAPGSGLAASGRAAREQRDMLMGGRPPSADRVPAPASGDRLPAAPPQVRPRTREEAEESVIQAIRSARGEA